MLDNAIISLIIGSSTGIILALMRYSFLSKCNKIDCLCCKIHRNTNEEQIIQVNVDPEVKN